MVCWVVGVVVGTVVGARVVEVSVPVPVTARVMKNATSPTSTRASRLTTIHPTEVRRSSSYGSA